MAVAIHFAKFQGQLVACGLGAAGPGACVWSDFLPAVNCPNCLGVLHTRAQGIPETKPTPSAGDDGAQEPYPADVDLLCKDE